MEKTYKELGGILKKLTLDSLKGSSAIVSFNHDSTYIYVDDLVLTLSIEKLKKGDESYLKGLLKYESYDAKFCGAIKFTPEDDELLKEINSLLIQLNKKNLIEYLDNKNLL